MDLNLSCIGLWKQMKTDEMPTTTTAEDAYSFGYTCTKLSEIVSKLRVRIKIKSLSDLRYLSYFRAEARDVKVDTREMQKFTANDQINLLATVEKCTKLSSLSLRTTNTQILSSKCFSSVAHKLVNLRVSLTELPKIGWPNFIESMEKCANLCKLHIEYDEVNLIDSVNQLNELFSIKLPKLRVFRFVTEDYDEYIEFPVMPHLATFLRCNNQLETVEINARLFDVYLETLILCPHLKEVTLYQDWPEVEDTLLAKLLALNKLPALECTTLTFVNNASESMSKVLRRVKSIKELTVKCNLSENFVLDLFKIPQLARLHLTVTETYGHSSFTQFMISLYVGKDYGFPKTVQQLRYYEKNLKTLTTLDLSRIDHIYTITSSDLTQFIKFIINCPKLELIEFHRLFPIDCFYTQLLKYKKYFRHHARDETLYLQIDNVRWIPGYSNGRRTLDIIIQDDNDNEPNTSICSITRYWFEKLLRLTPFLLLISIFVNIYNAFLWLKLFL